MNITAISLSILTIVSTIVSWFLAKRKYNTEVDNSVIANLERSLDFYMKLSDDNKNRLDEILRRDEEMQRKNAELERKNAELERKVRELESRMLQVLGSICMDLTCELRKRDTSTVKENK